MHALRDRPLLAMVSEATNRHAVVECAQAIAESGHARLYVLDRVCGCLSRTRPRTDSLWEDEPRGLEVSSLEAAKRFVANERPAMFVADWPAEPNPQDILRFVSTWNVPSVFVRWPPMHKVDRVLIPTSGGPHALRQLWIAKEMAARMGVPAHVIHVIQNCPSVRPGLAGSSSEATLTEVQARAMGISEPIEVCVAQDVVSGICSAVNANDLVAIGAPNYWRMANHFAGSIPDMIAKRLPNPLLMLLGRKNARIQLRDIFWPQMIRLDLNVGNKQDAIAALVQTLITHDQVPNVWRDLLFERAMARERIMSTSVGIETAFPHITVADFIGVAGCMGVVPGGVDFDTHRGRGTRFVFLLITPEDFYDEYLVVLSKIAERMVLPALRREILACKTPTDVLCLLDPDE